MAVRNLVFSPARPAHRQLPVYEVTEEEHKEAHCPKKTAAVALPQIQHAPPTGLTPKRRGPVVWTRTTPSHRDAVLCEFLPRPSPSHRTNQHVRNLSQALFNVDDIFLQPMLKGPDRHAFIPATPPKPKFVASRNHWGIPDGYCQEDDLYCNPVAYSSQTHRHAFVNLSPEGDGYLVDVLIPDERFRGIEAGSPALLCPDGTRPYTVENRPRALSFYQNPKGMERLVLGTEDGWIHIWDVDPNGNPALIFMKKISDEQIVQVAVSGEQILAATRTGVFFQINRYTREAVQLPSRPKCSILGLAFSKDRKYMVTGNNHEMIHLYKWDKRAGQYAVIAQYVGFKAGIKALSFSDDEPKPYLLVGGGHKNPLLGLWRVGRDKPLVQLDTGSQITSVTWLSKTMAVTTHHDGTIRYYRIDKEARTIEELDRVQGHDQRITFATSNGKNFLTTYSPNTGEIFIWDVPTEVEKPVKKKPPYLPFGSPSKGIR